MEDKRTLLAFLLIGLILLVLPYYYEMVGLAPGEEDEEAPPVTSRPHPISKSRDSKATVPEINTKPAIGKGVPL